MRSVDMLRLHNFIKEFYTYSNLIKDGTVSHFIRSFGLLPLGLLTAPWLIWKWKGDQSKIRWVWILFVFSAGLLALAMFQIRWVPAYAVSAVFLAIGSLWILTQHASGGIKRAWVMAPALALAIQSIVLMLAQVNELQRFLAGGNIVEELAQAAFIKRTALLLRDADPRPGVILADPNYAPAIGYFAEIPTIVSFYWENLGGLTTARDFFAAANEDEDAHALNLAKKHGITHVLLEPRDYLPNVFYFIKHGQFDLKASKATLANRMLYEESPLWVRSDLELTALCSRGFRFQGELLPFRMLVFKIEIKN